MKVRRASGLGGISWDTLQKLKNEHLGPDACAIEFFPPEYNTVDELNMRHLWEVPESMAPLTRRG